MAEDNLEVILDPVEPNVEETTPDAPAPSKYDETARAQGWVPKEEWAGDPDDWTDSREFVKRGELFHKISNQSGEIKELRKAISGLMEHHSKVKETEFTRALTYLKGEKKKALEEGDADQLIAVDEAIEQLKAEKPQEAPKAQQATGPTPVFTSWVSQNPWYLQDQQLRAFADDIGVGFFNRNPGTSEAELYQLVKQRVMKQFPEKFKGQGSKTPSVEGAGSAPTKKNDSFKLSEDEERVMKTFVRSGVMTKEQYVSELRRVKGE